MSHPIEIELAEKLKNIIPYAEMVRFGKMDLMFYLLLLGWQELIQKKT